MDRSILPVIVGAVCTISGLVAGFCAYPLEMTHPVETLKVGGFVDPDTGNEVELRQEEDSAPPMLSSLKMEAVDIPHFVDGKLSALLNATEVHYRGAGSPAVLINPVVTRYKPDGTILSVIKADRGTIVLSGATGTMALDSLKLMGNVEMQHYEELMGKKGDQ